MKKNFWVISGNKDECMREYLKSGDHSNFSYILHLIDKRYFQRNPFCCFQHKNGFLLTVLLIWNQLKIHTHTFSEKEKGEKEKNGKNIFRSKPSVSENHEGVSDSSKTLISIDSAQQGKYFWKVFMFLNCL